MKDDRNIEELINLLDDNKIQCNQCKKYFFKSYQLNFPEAFKMCILCWNKKENKIKRKLIDNNISIQLINLKKERR